MAVNDIIQLQLQGSITGDNTINNFYYRTETEPTTGDEEDELADIFATLVIPDYLTATAGDMSYDCIRTQKVFPLPLRAARDKFINFTGSVLGEAVTAAVAAIIQKYDPAVAGKGKKGHVFIPGVSEDQVAKGRIGSVLEGNLQILADQLTAPLTSVGGGVFNAVWAILSPLAPHAITGVVDWTRSVVLPRLGGQSRRKTNIRKIS